MSNDSLINKLRTNVIKKYKADPLHINPHKVFYVCSYGGSGSKVLCDYLRHFGTVKHVHSRYPPTTLTHIGINTKWHEWFSTIPIHPQDLHKYYVIYIYRDPIKAIQSRFEQPNHLAHIQTNPTITLDQVVNSKQDLYGIESFFDNYTNTTTPRNYKIYCIKYEELFKNIPAFNQMFNIQCSKDLYPIEKTTSKSLSPAVEKTLQDIYGNLMKKMRALRFITVV
jgi:hypothetical protein